MTTIYYPAWVPFADAIALCQSAVFISKQYRDDAPLRLHELVHVAQMRRDGTLTFWWRYLTSKARRQGYEVEAYKAQIAAGASLDACAGNLSRSYYLGIHFIEAQKLLRT